MKKMTLDQIREMSVEYQMTHDNTLGVCALVDVDNTGFCCDGVTKWYTFLDDDGNECIYYKY